MMDFIVNKEEISLEMLNLRLLDLRCKHVLNLSDLSKKVLKESEKAGYLWCNWGIYENRGNSFQDHLNIINKMEKDQYFHSVRIVICNYNFHEEPVIWTDNLHSTILYLRKFGPEVTLEQIPFYIIDLTKTPILCSSYRNSLREEESSILGAIHSANLRKEWSNSVKIIESAYTLQEFIKDNPNFLL